MVIPSEPVKLEGENEFTEYTGSGKLKGKKALITGGEYVFTRDGWLFNGH